MPTLFETLSSPFTGLEFSFCRCLARCFHMLFGFCCSFCSIGRKPRLNRLRKKTWINGSSQLGQDLIHGTVLRTSWVKTTCQSTNKSSKPLSTFGWKTRFRNGILSATGQLDHFVSGRWAGKPWLFYVLGKENIQSSQACVDLCHLWFFGK